MNELMAENHKTRAEAEEAERSAAIRAELQKLGVAKIELAYKAVKDEIYRDEDGRLLAPGGAELRDYLATVRERESGAAAGAGWRRVGGERGQRRSPAEADGMDLERIRPGMSAEEQGPGEAGDCEGGVADAARTVGSVRKSGQKEEKQMGTITSANVATAIVKLVAADALPALMGNLVMGNLVNRDYEPTLAQAGDTVNVPIPPTLVANNIAEGGTVQTAESATWGTRRSC